jgi:hypothetical protein
MAGSAIARPSKRFGMPGYTSKCGTGKESLLSIERCVSLCVVVICDKPKRSAAVGGGGGGSCIGHCSIVSHHRRHHHCFLLCSLVT